MVNTGMPFANGGDDIPNDSQYLMEQHFINDNIDLDLYIFLVYTGQIKAVIVKFNFIGHINDPISLYNIGFQLNFHQFTINQRDVLSDNLTSPNLF